MHWEYKNEEESKRLTIPSDKHRLHAALSKAEVCDCVLLALLWIHVQEGIRAWRWNQQATLFWHPMSWRVLGSLNPFLTSCWSVSCIMHKSVCVCVNVWAWFSKPRVSALWFWMFKVNLKVDLNCALLLLCIVLASLFWCMNSQFLTVLHTSKSC